MKKSISAALGLLVSLASASCARAWDAPNYRVFRGYRRADVPAGEFVRKLGAEFIPAAPATHQKNGLIAYVPAVLPADAPPGSPDEIAIVVYESPEVYAIARNTPEGKVYADLHWTLFEEPSPSGQSLDDHRTKSHSAVPFDREVKLDEPVDVIKKYADWQAGHTTVFVGARADGIPADRFAAEVSQHLAKVRDAFEGQGLDGYIAVVHTEKPHAAMQEIAWMHWTSRAAMEKAFASTAGRKIAEDSARLFRTVMWTDAPGFPGSIAPGQAVNVRFPVRPRP